MSNLADYQLWLDKEIERLTKERQDWFIQMQMKLGEFNGKISALQESRMMFTFNANVPSVTPENVINLPQENGATS